jgi:PAS domain S-box-containing protein
MSIYDRSKDIVTTNNPEPKTGPECELLQCEERYLAMLEFSPAAILLHRDGVFIYANGAACRLLGASHPGQLIGMSVMALVPPEYQEQVTERIGRAELLFGQVNERLEQRVISLDGSLIDVEVVGMHLVYQGLAAVQVTMLDISARRQVKQTQRDSEQTQRESEQTLRESEQALQESEQTLRESEQTLRESEQTLRESEQTLRESEQTLRNLIEVMPVGVVLMGSDGSIGYLNRCFEETFGYSHADIPTIAKWGASAYPDPEYREKLVAILEGSLKEARETGKPLVPVEVRVTCKDGSVRHVILNRQIAGDSKIAIHTDITERESRQNEILKVQKLESLGVLAGGIAHDFNNILTGILGNISFARMFLRDASGGAPASSGREGVIAGRRTRHPVAHLRQRGESGQEAGGAAVFGRGSGLPGTARGERQGGAQHTRFPVLDRGGRGADLPGVS